MRRAIAIAAGLFSLAFAGCTVPYLAQRMVQAPNTQGLQRPEDPKRAELFNKTCSQEFMVPVGPPRAVLSVAVIEPGDYGLKYDLTISEGPKGLAASYRLSWNLRPAGSTPVRAKGTVVLLHGILMNKETVIHWALYLAERGYRTVLVDLRGHGDSTGEWITFGSAERRDLAQVLDELERRGLVAGRVGALGISYGAAMALDWAAIDPRVATVVALEPFSDPRRAIVEFARSFAADQVKGVTDAQFAAAEDKAARYAHFQWADDDVMAAVRRMHVPVLFFHGAKDTWIPRAHSERLMSVAPAGSRLRVLADDNHVTLSIRLKPIAREVAAWFDAHLAPGPGG